MFYKKEGIPQESDIVLCTIKKILFHSVFVDLDEYKKLEGLLHISEVSPGRIRNIRDYVKEGKKIVCKVLKVDEEKGHIDLSLRRVNQGQRINKINEYKQAQKAEKILSSVAKKLDISLEDVYKKFGYDIINKYENLNSYFQELLLNGALIKELKLSDKIEKILLEIVNERMKPSRIKISALISLQNNLPNGIELTKKILIDAEKISKEDKVEISYISAPRYRINIDSTNYKSAEATLKEIVDFALNKIKDNKGVGEFLGKEK